MSVPVLYEANATDFFNKGLGTLPDALTSVVTEERNGEFIFEMTYPADGARADLLENNRIIKVDAGHVLKDQRFVIKKTAPQMSEDGKIYIDVYAEHISYITNDLALKPSVTVSGSANDAMQQWRKAIIDSNEITADSDITTSNSTAWTIDKVQTARQALGGVDGSILDVWGGEYLFDNLHISLKKQRGSYANTLLAYGRNITSFQQEENIEDTYTSIYPYATLNSASGDTSSLYTIDNYVVDSQYVGNYPNRKILPVDFSSNFENVKVGTKASDASDSDTTVYMTVAEVQSQLKALVQQYITNNDVGIPTVSISVSFVDLSKTSNYADVAPLERLDLCDIVPVRFTKLGIDTTAKVTHAEWNVLTDSYDKIELGSITPTLGQTLNMLTTVAQAAKQVAQDAQNNATIAWQSADGKATTFKGSSSQAFPTAQHIGDLYWRENGDTTEVYIWDGSEWAFQFSNKTGQNISEAVDKAMAEADTAKQNANAAVEIGNQALTKAQAGIDIANAAADNANTAMSNSSTAINNAKSAMTDAANAINTANNSSDIANAVQQQVTTLKDGSTMTIADLANGLALKLVKSDLNGYATQSWASSQITATANDLQSQVASVKSTADKATTDITTLNQRASGWDSTISSLSTNKADQSWTTNQIKASADSLNVNISKVQTQVSSLNFGSYNILNGTGMDDSTTKLHQGVGGISYAVTINSDSSSPTGKSFTLARTDGGTTQGGAYWEVPAPLTVGKQYSWSIWAKGTGVINTVGPEQGGQSSITLTSAYTKYTKTFTATSSQYSQFTFYGNDGNVNATFLPIVLIEGNISPSWCRSVSDTATVTEVTNLSIALDGIKQTVSKKVDNDMFNSYKTQTATLIDSKVASNDFNSYKTQTDNALSQRVTSALFNSYQTQTDKAIQQRVTSATYNAEVTTLSNMINSKVSLNDITVGGTNLIPLGNIVTATSTQTSYDSTNDIRTITVANGAGGSWGGGLQNNAVTKHEIPWGQSYTYSVEIKPSVDGLIWNSDTNTYPYGVSAWGGNDNDNVSRRSSNSSMGGGTGTKLIPNVWNKVWVTIINSDSRNSNKVSLYDNSTICVVNTTGSTVTVLFRHFKGELGNVPTDYSPAPDDINSQIQQLSDNINLCVVKNDVINQINLSTEGILIAGKKVHISGQTTIDNAVIKSAMIDSISADKITAGTLNAANVNVINLNANNISSGTLSGDYISGGTITGVSFHQSSSGHDTWIDGNGVHDYDGSGNNAWIQKGNIQVYDNAGQGMFMKGGKLILSNLDVWGTIASMSSGTKPPVDDYGVIEHGVGMGLGGIKIHGGGGSALLTDNDGKQAGVIDTGYYGIVDGGGVSASWNLAMLGGDQDWCAAIKAGKNYGNYIADQPSLLVGTADWPSYTGSTSTPGKNIVAQANGIWLYSIGETHVDCSSFYFAGAHCDGGSLYNANYNGWWMRDKSGNLTTVHAQSFANSSLLSLKTNISEIDSLTALNKINQTRIYDYQYKSDVERGSSKHYASYVIDDINDVSQYTEPDEFLSEDKKGRDDGTQLAYATLAIQELSKQIEEIKKQNQELKQEIENIKQK
ncbi:phage tail spike protein [Liquorilactobacillus nagelii]|uniref:phage tail spike protein n=1 Tax=Liquorilactobacillus nagelii TaxID=82688 RepID=UPI00242FB208|nr:phage tail spike protein [Liquorilactobacillus nagelii]MCI1699475.1 gp58-like family protein [Liquorilactobacillus nagelii]